MKAEIISIGDELLIGQVVNTNASWMGTQLNLAGIEVVRISTIADKQNEILEALEEAGRRAQVILLTGGLGPTRDDITKKTLCHYFNTSLQFDAKAFEMVENLFQNRGFKVTEINRQQAELPKSCTPIYNPNGTASGMWFEKDDRIFISMPGVPFEMRPMMTDQILPRLRQISGHCIVHKTILTHGVGESFLAEVINTWELQLPSHLKLAYLPQPGIVRLRISAYGQDQVILKQEIETAAKKLTELIPDLIFGYDTQTMESVVGDLLKNSQKTLSIAESCTGGYISHLMTRLPGSSAFFQGSAVCYQNAIKTQLLGVKEHTLEQHGAVSKAVVEEMAEGAKNLLKTDYALATSGIAGPDGGSREKPVGTIWIALASPIGTESACFHFGEHRERNIRKTALAALNLLRKALLQQAIQSTNKQ